MITGITGWTHVVSAVLALLLGTMVVWMKKGTAMHRKIGRLYALSMIMLNISAFLIYRLFGFFGPFHIAAVVSMFSIIAGVSAAFFRKPEKAWLEVHRRSMGWSVIGLYAAFVSETGVRFFPPSLFWPVVAGGTMLVTVVGAYFLYRSSPA